MSYELESIAVVSTFAHYAQNRRLPAELFNHPDYISLRATDIQDFEQRVKEVVPKAEQITVVEAEERFVAAVKLVGTLGVVDLGKVHWLEIIEPTKEEVLTGMLGGDRVGFYYDDFEKARHVLGAKNVPYIIDEHPTPSIKVEYSKTGDQFCISPVSIETIVESDIDAERVTFIKQTF